MSFLYTGNVTATLIGSYGTDRLIAEEAWLSTNKQSDDDDKIKTLIDQIVRMHHDKAIETVHLHFEVILPISCDRQLVTYRVLVASIANSGRYGSVPDEFYVPPEIDTLDEEDKTMWFQISAFSLMYYKDMLSKYSEKFGKTRAREIFRDLLGQGQFTKRRFIINLRNFIHFLEERLADKAQYEIRELAKQMYLQAKPVAPFTFEALEKYRGLKVN